MPNDTLDEMAREIKELRLARDIEQFLYAEAELLDERRFDQWLDLFTDDARYWMPMRRNVKFGEQERENTREGEEVAWFDEGKETLIQRVQQIKTGIHWAEEPLSRVCHVISNVQILDIRGDEVNVKSRFIAYRNRLEDETDFFVGKREDTLRRVNGAWKIVRRAVFLDQNVLMAKNLTIFL
jgi:3-phenylpropionate/cinnamic acid dioxygenase small subunit